MAINPKIEISAIDDNHRSVEFTVSVGEMDKLFERNLGEFRKQVSMKGFRPGQVPKQLFVSRFGDEVYRDTVEKVVQSELRAEFGKIVDKWKADEKLEIAAPAEHGNLQFARGQELVYKLDIALNKPLTAQGYKDLGVSMSASVVSEDEVKDIMEGLRKRFAKEIPASRPAKHGDVIRGSYLKRVIDGKDQLLPSQKCYFEVGDDMYGKELEEALTGLSAGDEKDISIHYPDEHRFQELRGKTADCRIAVSEVCELELPAQDEEFYSKIGAKGEEDFKARVMDDILKEKEQKARQIALKDAFDKLIAKNPFPVLEEQVKYTAERSMARYNENDEEEENIEVPKEQLDAMRPDIVRAIQEDRLLRSIVEQEGLKPTQGQVDARIEELAKSAGMDFAFAKDAMRKNGQINSLRESLKKELAQNILIGGTLPERAQEDK